MAQQHEGLCPSPAPELLAFASSELSDSKQLGELGEYLSTKKLQQTTTPLVSDGQEHLRSPGEVPICSASSSSESCQTDMVVSEAAVTRTGETIVLTRPPEAAVHSTVIAPSLPETAPESLDAVPVAQAVRPPHQSQEGSQVEGWSMGVEVPMEVPQLEPTAPIIGKPFGPESQVEASDSALTLSASSSGPQNRRKISLSSYKQKKARQAGPTRAEGLSVGPQGDGQHTTQLELMSDEGNARKKDSAAMDTAGASPETQALTPPHSHDNSLAENPPTPTMTHGGTNSNGLDLGHGNRALIKFKFAQVAKSVGDKIGGNRLPVTKTIVMEKILGKPKPKPDKKTLVLETATAGSGQLGSVTTYSKFQPGCLPQVDEPFGSPEPEACEIDQGASVDATGANTDSKKVEEYPILSNPVMQQLGTGGAIASFLQSKENDKAAEWSFWGSAPAPKVSIVKMQQLGTGGAIASFLQSKENDKAAEWSFWGSAPAPKVSIVKSSAPIVHVAHNQVQSSGQHEPMASSAVPSGFKIMEPKPKTPLSQQSKTVSSRAKGRHNQPTASTTTPGTPGTPMLEPNKQLQSNTIGQPAAEIVSQRNAVFLTDDGKITTFPPGATTASSDTYVLSASVEVKDGEGPADGQEFPTELFPQLFVARMRELEDIQYDAHKSERHSDAVEYKARDVDRDAPPDGAVGGQLPAALRCPECLRFHHGRCNRPSLPCILCGGQHWVKQCNCKSLRLAKTYRPGISCTRCRFMHKNQCPTGDACPICLRVHEDLCLKPSGTCRYCGREHWENSCPRWEQLDEEMGFCYEPGEDKAFQVADMAERVVKFWDPSAPYFGRLKTKQQGKLDIEPGECVTQGDFLQLVDRRDELRRLPPTYANAKAVKRDLMSTLFGKNGPNVGQRDRAYRDRSPIGRENEVKVCRTLY